jgi:signal transduction histidine kinase
VYKTLLTEKWEVPELAIQNNGQGFDSEKAFHAGSVRKWLSLSSMRERIEISRGSFAMTKNKED